MKQMSVTSSWCYACNVRLAGGVLPPGCGGCVRSYILTDWLPAAAMNRLSGLIAILFSC